MKIAFSSWDDRIAPVFDAARQITIVQIKSKKIIGESQIEMPSELPVQKAIALIDMGVETLVCGAISKPLHSLLVGYGIRVIAFITGELRQVVFAFQNGEIDQDDFAMPGCCRRRRGIEQEVFVNNRNRGGGMGQGRGGRMGGFSSGAVGVCVCPQCGHRQAHERGVPCTQIQCPNCGTLLTRENQQL